MLSCGGKAGRTCWQHQKVLLGDLQVRGKEVQGLFQIMSESKVLLVANTSCVFSPMATLHGCQQEFDGGMDERVGKGLR